MRNVTTGEVLAGNARLASSLWSRFRGLMGQRDISPDFALCIPGCNQIHTWGVRVPLDVVFCDRAGRVLLVVQNLAPNRVSPRAPGGYWAWEARAGHALAAGRAQVGHVLQAVPGSALAP